MYYSQLVKTACSILFQAHRDDLDKGGYPYVFHPFYLATQMDDEASTCVALLHDVIEDHGDMYSFVDLERAGFPAPVLDALRLLTHTEGVPYMDYVQALAKKFDRAQGQVRRPAAQPRHPADRRRCARKKGHLSAGAGLSGENGITNSAGRACPVRRCGFILRAKDQEKKKTCNRCGYRLFSGAATRIRTGDLILTKDALYRLSYSSIQIPRSFRSAGGDREGT